MNIVPLLAVLSGEAVVNAIIYIIVFGLIFWLLHWLLSYVAIPDPFAKVAKVVLAVAAVIILINCLLMLAGRPLFRW